MDKTQNYLNKPIKKCLLKIEWKSEPWTICGYATNPVWAMGAGAIVGIELAAGGSWLYGSSKWTSSSSTTIESAGKQDGK